MGTTPEQRRERDLGRLAKCLVAAKSSDRCQMDGAGGQAIVYRVVGSGDPGTSVTRQTANAWRTHGWVEVERVVSLSPALRRITYRVTDWGHEALAERHARLGEGGG